MLPFLKKKEGMVASNADDEVLKREPDDGDGFDMLDAVADDFMLAFEQKDKGLLKAALEALCDYVKEEDEKQDEHQLEGQE